MVELVSREPKNPKLERALQIQKEVELFQKKEEQEKAVKTKLTEIFADSPLLAKQLQELYAYNLKNPLRMETLFQLCVQAYSGIQTAVEKSENDKGGTADYTRKKLAAYHKTLYGYDETEVLPLTQAKIVTHHKGFADYYVAKEKAFARNKTFDACRKQEDELIDYTIRNASNLNEIILYAFGKTAVFKYIQPEPNEAAIATPSETSG